MKLGHLTVLNPGSVSMSIAKSMSLASVNSWASVVSIYIKRVELKDL